MREKLANLRKNQKKNSSDRSKQTQSKINFGKRKLSDDGNSEEKKQKSAERLPPSVGSLPDKSETGILAGSGISAMDQFAASDDE